MRLFDVHLLGDCDIITARIMRELGWTSGENALGECREGSLPGHWLFEGAVEKAESESESGDGGSESELEPDSNTDSEAGDEPQHDGSQLQEPQLDLQKVEESQPPKPTLDIPKLEVSEESIEGGLADSVGLANPPSLLSAVDSPETETLLGLLNGGRPE